MDYSLNSALQYKSSGLKEFSIFYDIACQYSVKLKDRFEKSTLLSISPHAKLLFAVGKFHLSAHIDECFYKFSPNFQVGAGQVEGEIVETFWSGLNRVSRMARTMTLYHRQEFLDAYTRNYNWKKVQGMGMFPFVFPSG